MSLKKNGYLLLCGLLAVAACGEPNEELDTKTGEIIRSTSNGGRDQVVMVYAVRGDGGRTLCSGSYYAPRVVVTAAHCIPANIYQMFVYYGDNLQQDMSELTSDGFIGLVPPPEIGRAHV